MKSLQTVLTDYAFGLGQAGKIAQTVAPLYAAKLFGGSVRADEIANVVGWALADQAIKAIEDRKLADAQGLASLGLAVAADNVKCLYALCAALERANLPALANLARRFDEHAVSMDAPIRLRALQFLSSAIFGPERRGSLVDVRDLERRLSALLNDHPGLKEAEELLAVARREMSAFPEPSAPTRPLGATEAVNQSLADIYRRGADGCALNDDGEMAAAFCAGLLWAAQAQPHDADRRRGALREIRQAVDEAADASDDAAVARMAMIVAIDPDMGTLAALMQRLWDRDDREGMRAAAAIGLDLKPEDNAEWVNVAHLSQIARLAAERPELDRAGLEAAAIEAVIEKTDRLLAESPERSALRAARTFLASRHRKYGVLWRDCKILLDEMKTNRSLEQIYSNVISRQCMFLRKVRDVGQLRQIVDYIFEDERSIQAEKEFLFYYCASFGCMELAYEVAARLAETTPPWGALAYLRDFMRVADQRPAAVFGRPRTGKRLIYGNLVCWGETFIEKMAWSSLPSLMSPRNIPALVKENDVVIDVITHQSNVEALVNLPELKLLSELCEIRIYCFPYFAEFFEWSRSLPYIVFGHAQHFSVLRAQQDDADVLVLSADVVYADGCFEFVARHVSDEPRALFYDGLNCSQTPLRERLAPHRVNSVLTVDAKTLAEFAVQTMKPILQQSFFSKTGQSTKVSSPAIILRKSFGFRVYGGMQGVAYVSAAGLRGLTGFDHLTLEGVCSEVILNKLTPEQIIVRKTTDDILWVELDDNDRIDSIPLGEAMVSHVDAVKNFFLGYSRCLRRFQLFEMAVDCHVGGLTYGDEIDDETERKFLDDLRRLRLTDPVFTELCQP